MHGGRNDVTEQRAALFGRELRRLRMDAGLSLAQLSQLVHYSKGYLSKIETGAKLPSVAVASRCDAAVNAGGALTVLVTARPARSANPYLGPWDAVHDLGMHWDLGVAQPAAGSAGEAGGGDRAGGGSPLSALSAPLRAAVGWPARLAAARAQAGRVASQVRTDLLVLAARYVEHIGTLAHESGHAGTARWWSGQADQLACRGCRAGATIYPVRGRNIG
jgi:hypothetical protein